MAYILSKRGHPVVGTSVFFHAFALKASSQNGSVTMQLLQPVEISRFVNGAKEKQRKFVLSVSMGGVEVCSESASEYVFCFFLR